VASPKKGARRTKSWIVFEDESGFSLTPSVRKTWAPRGKTPVLVHRQRNWLRISAAAVVGYRWDGRRARLYFHLRPGSYNAEGLIDFLTQLRRHFRGQRVLLLWDGLNSHHSGRMRNHLAAQAHWLTVERLPAYAPELNPVEGVWANLKGNELANRCDLEIADTIQAAQTGVRRVRGSQQLLFSFLGQAGLSL
jgi:transposase